MEPFERINQLLSRDEPFCVATVLSSPPHNEVTGAKVIIQPEGLVEFTTGSADLDGLIALVSRECIKENKKQIKEVIPGYWVFFDLHARNYQLVICGAGHIALPLARYATDIGFEVTVIDDREDYATPERFPGCEVIAGEFIPALRKVQYGDTTYIVVITRGHEHDFDCLREVLKHETGYAGLIGSRRRVSFVLEMLEREGIPRERVENVFTPIGIPIGGESPEEIALSIAAELVSVRHKGREYAINLRARKGI